MKPKLLIFSSRTNHNAPRIIREVNALAPFFDITLTGRTPLEYKNVHNVYHDGKVPFADRLLHYILRKFNNGKPLTRRFPIAYKTRAKLVSEIKPEVVIIHEPENLPYFVHLREKHGFKLMFNAHEYHPLEFEDRPEWLATMGVYYHHLYKEYLSRVDLLINVCDSIAEKCKDEFGVDSIVIPNAALYKADIKPTVCVANPIKIIQHGAGIRERNIELMIEVMQLLGNGYTLDLMIMKNNQEYYEELKQKVEKTKNVKLIEPVSFDQIVPVINQYDIGMYYIQPGNYNNNIALPNKLFEFIQARLCIVISPSVEMKKLVEQYELGRVSREFTARSLADAVLSLSVEEINSYKQQADKVAFELSAEQYQEKMLKAMQII